MLFNPELLCNLPTPHYLVFSSIIPKIVYYSHLPILAGSLALGLFVYFRGKKYLANRVLFAMLMAFSCWLFFDMITWASNRPDLVMFSWSTLVFFETMVYAGGFYLANVILLKRDLSRGEKWMTFALLLPVLVSLPTNFNVSGFDLVNCLSIEGSVTLYYAYGVELLLSLWVLVISIRSYRRTSDKNERSFVAGFASSLLLFLVLFTSGNIFGSVTTNWNVAQFGLFGMPVLAGFIMYMIVKRQFFNIKLVASQVLVFAIIALSAAQFILTETATSKILNALSFGIIVIFGYFLIKGIRREEEKGILENLTQDIYKKNVEMSIKNKTLSLLRTLYQTSILSLDPAALSAKLSEAIRKDLNLELAGIFSYNKEKDMLTPFHFSKSDRLIESLDAIGFRFRDVIITEVSKRPFFKTSMQGGVSSSTTKISEVWEGLVSSDYLKKLDDESHVKTVIAFPLIIERTPIGMLLLGLNRDYDTLNTFEKESIKSLIDVVSVALDRSNLYKEVQDANEKLKSLDKLKTEFLSLASHQLRSPLTAIKGYTSMLLQGDFGSVNDNQKEAIDRVFQSSNHLTRIVEDLLNTSKIEQGGMQYTMTPFDLRKTAEDLVKDLSVTAEKKGLTLTFSAEGKEPFTVNGDMEKLRQVLLNLTDNALKYTEKGTIAISVAKDKTGKKIIWSSKDTGMGIPPEILPTLFQKFSRGEGGRVNTGGSGLGLYLAKEIVGAHKGRVWAESEGKGKGAQFYVELDAV